jgi:hypothetical protein
MAVGAAFALGLVTSVASDELNIPRDAAMSGSSESEVAKRFNDLLEAGELERLSIIHSVTDGMLGEGRVEKQLLVSNGKQARARTISAGSPAQEATAELAEAEVRSLFELIGKGVESLVSRSRARFVPDSALGSITLGVGGRRATFFYLADQEQREAQGQSLSPAMADSLSRVESIYGEVFRRQEK